MKKFMLLSALIAMSLNLTSVARADNEGFVPAASPSPQHLPANRLSEDDQEVLEQGKMSTGRYVAGGVVATVVGFGIGHAIQGRYWPLGFVYTIGEAGGITMIVAGAVKCISTGLDNFASNGTTTTCTDSQGNGLLTAGVITLIGFHLWEVIDAWVAPNSQNRRYDELKAAGYAKGFAIIPTPYASRTSTSIDGARLAVEFRF